MKYNKLDKIIIDLPYEEMKEIYSNDKQTLSVFRPLKLSKEFKEYDASKNVQIWLKTGNKKPFKPNISVFLLTCIPDPGNIRNRL